MQISALSQGKKDKERVNVYIDGEFFMALDKDTLVQEKLFVGKEVDQQYVNSLKDTDTYNFVSRKIINWSLLRPRSSKEIEEKILKLIRKRDSSSFNKDVDIKSLTEFVIEKADKIGVNDDTFGKWWVSQRKLQKKYGEKRVYMELIKKGLTPAHSKKLLKDFGKDSSNTASELLKKKFNVSSIKEITDYNQKAKAYRYLVSRGFKPV